MRSDQSGFLQYERKRDFSSVSRRPTKRRVEETELQRILEQIQHSTHRFDNALSEVEAILWTELGLKVQ
jgi:hypothetical protein